MGKIQKKVISLRRVPDDKSLTLTVKILRINEKLIEHFQNNQFGKMAELLGELHAIFIAPDYRIYYGGDSAGEWKNLKERGATLIIEPVNFFLSGIMPIKKVENKEYDGYGFVVQKFRVIVKTKEGKMLQNQSGGLGIPGRHQGKTPW